MEYWWVALLVFVIEIIIMIPIAYFVHKKGKEKEQKRSLSMLKSIVADVNFEIKKTIDLNPSIEKDSIIEGTNTSKYLDQGVIRDKKREYFFTINTPAIETVDGDYRPYSHLNKQVTIKIEGTVNSYTITATEKVFKYNSRMFKVVFSSQTNEITENIEEIPYQKQK